MKRRFRILKIWWNGRLQLAMKLKEINYIADRHRAYERSKRFIASMQEKYSAENYFKLLKELGIGPP